MASQPLRAGKLPPELLEDLLGQAPAQPPEVRIGPRPGEDAAAIEIPAGTLVAATDPITLTSSGVGAHAVVINANDVAVMGVQPRWFLATILLPEGTTEAELRALFVDMVAELGALGAALVGGHTEVTAAVSQPVVVGQMLGLATDRPVVATGGLIPGDVVVQIGHAPVEGALVAADSFAHRLGGIDPKILSGARNALKDPGISVVEPALLAAELGARAMHDPTEGGLSAGLHELSSASGCTLTLEEDAVLWFEPGLTLCRALGVDPWGVLASGTLLAGFGEDLATDSIQTLSARGFPARRIGVASPGEGVRLASGGALPRFERDELSRLLEER